MPDQISERARAVTNTILTLVALFVVGPVASWPIALLHGPDGGHTSSLLVSNRPLLGVLALLVLFVAAFAIGIVKARFFGWARGLFAAGCVLAWGAARTGNMDDLYMVTTEAAPTARLVIETLLVAILAAGLAVVLLKGAGEIKDPSQHEIPGVRDPKMMLDKSSIAGLFAAAAAMILFTWVFVQTPLRMQAVVGGACAAIAAGAAAVFVGMQVGHKLTALAPVLGVLLVGLASPIAAQMFADGTLAVDARGGQLVPLALLQPLDWAAAAMLGVPTGIGWAASLLEKQLTEEPDPMTRRRRSPA